MNKFLVVFVACLFFIVSPVQAESYSDLFIKITDATTAVRDKDQEKAHTLVSEIKEEFLKKANHDSKAGKEVQKSLDLEGEITEKELVTVSASLLAFEKEQNPVDLDAEKKKLETRLQPYFDKLQEAITAKDLQATRKAYADLNNTWTRNEAVVRDHSTAYYGKVETAISFLRSAIETEPTNFDSIQSSYNDLKNVLDQFIIGEKIEETSSNLTLSDGIKLLKKALSLFQANDTSQASQVMKEFITIWPTIEGDVSTTNPILGWKVKVLSSWSRGTKASIKSN